MTDDELVSRLRATVMIDPSSGLEAQINPDGPEAAARLEALAAEKARLEGALELIAALDWKNGATNCAAFDAFRIATEALAPSGISEGGG